MQKFTMSKQYINENEKMVSAIWTAMYAEFPLHEALRVLHECGWGAFEISAEHLVTIETDHNPQCLIEKTLDTLQDLELSAPQAHACLEADVADPDVQKRGRDIKRLLHHIDISASLGVQNVVIHPGGKLGDTQTEQKCVQKLNIEAFRRLGDFAGERAIRIGIENMKHQGATTPPELLELLKLIDHSAIGITLDTSHANTSTLNVAQVVREFGPHLVATHISDSNANGSEHLIPGGGTIDWPAVMDAFRDVDYRGLFNMEIPGARSTIPRLQQLKTCFALDISKWLINLVDSEK
jgi:sugar phosphate isomerase/epimerase